MFEVLSGQLLEQVSRADIYQDSKDFVCVLTHAF